MLGRERGRGRGRCACVVWFSTFLFSLDNERKSYDGNTSEKQLNRKTSKRDTKI